MEATKIISTDSVDVRMEDPALVTTSAGKPKLVTEFAVAKHTEAGGRYRMPKIYRMPAGEIGLTFSMSIDGYYDQGRISPFYTSKDEGKTWVETPWPHPGLCGIHPTISPVLNGEYYCIPARSGINIDKSRMPVPAGKLALYLGYDIYRLSECPQDVIDWYTHWTAVRWTPETGWREEPVRYDHKRQIIWVLTDTEMKIPGYWGQKMFTEHPIINSGNELFYADTWTIWADDDGAIPGNWESHLMVSTDNARSWQRKSRLTRVPIEGHSSCEPIVEFNPAGDMVCVIRSQLRRETPPMLLLHSKDKGYTWSEPKTIHGYGVMPQLLLLENGVLALSYGRSPGTWLSFSIDGGYSWTEPIAVLDPKDADFPGCGYTSLMALGPDDFLIAYFNGHYKNDDGTECKAALVRQITVKAAK